MMRIRRMSVDASSFFDARSECQSPTRQVELSHVYQTPSSCSLTSPTRLLFHIQLMMDQSKAINALAPFIALAKSANSPRAAADLVHQATSSPNTYVFAELLQQPNIQALASNEQYASSLTLLQTFAWGTWESYHGTFFSMSIT